MNTTSLDQAITAYHDSSRPMTPPIRNSTSPLPQNSHLPNNNNNNIHKPHSRSKQDTQTKPAKSAESGDEALGVRERPDCRGLAWEGERLIRNGEFEESIPLLKQGLMMSVALESCDYNLVSVLWSLLGNAHYSLGEFLYICFVGITEIRDIMGFLCKF